MVLNFILALLRDTMSCTIDFRPQTVYYEKLSRLNKDYVYDRMSSIGSNIIGLSHEKSCWLWQTEAYNSSGFQPVVGLYIGYAWSPRGTSAVGRRP